MKIHRIIEGTYVNGPGFRLGVWVQGCNRNCLGCFNKDACEATGGFYMSVMEILELLKNQIYDGISISGGEPFNQKSELKVLLKEVKKMGLGTLVFTGFTYEEICNTEAIKYCDYLIDGPFIKEIPPVCKYTGSGNQRFLKLKNGKIAEDLTLQYKGVNETEIIIQEDGSVLITGFSEI